MYPRGQEASGWRPSDSPSSPVPSVLRTLAARPRPSSASATPPRPPAPSRRPRPGGRRPLVDLATSGLGIAALRHQRPRAQAAPVRPRPVSPSSTPRLGPGLAALEGTERALFEKKRRIRQALEEGKPIRPSPPSSATRSTSCGGRSTSRTSSFRPSGKRELVRRVRCQFLLSFFLLKRVEACMHS